MDTQNSVSISFLLCVSIGALANSNGKRGGQVSASHDGKVYRRRFVLTRLAATLLAALPAEAAPCFAFFVF